MKVVIFCGGLGARLREETEFRPKPMIDIGGRPILWHIMKSYAHYGFKDFVLCLGYKGEMIKEYFYNYHMRNHDLTVTFGPQPRVKFHQKEKDMDWNVTLIDTGLESLKGERLKRVEEHIDGKRFMLTYGDGVANIDLAQLLEFHKAHGCVGTVCGVQPPSRFGELVINKDKVVAFNEKPQVSGGWINGGFFIFEKSIFKQLKVNDTQDFEYGTLAHLAKKGQLQVHEHKGQWECMDTYRDVQYLNKIWQEQRAFWKVWQDE